MKKQNKDHKEQRQKEINGYLLGKDLGQGTFGKVKLGTHKVTGEKVAIKVLEKNKIFDVADTNRVTREIHILKMVRHPSIVQLYDIVQTPKKLLLVTQYVQKGELFNYIVSKKRIQQVQACRLFHQLIDGIQYIHQIGIAHRDLKPQNLLLDYRMNLKIVDFGLSNLYKKTEKLRTPCGSQSYAAPEMLQGLPYQGIKIDIWASGVILFAMLCGYLPFDNDEDVNALYQKIFAGSYTIHDSVSQSGRDLICKILNVDAQHRYTISQIRKHPWMTMNLQKSRPSHSRGIKIGYNQIPIDSQILNSLTQYGLTSTEIQKTQSNLQANSHNRFTTTYYLALKKFLRNGGESEYDIENEQFNWKSLDPINLRNKKSTREMNKILIDNFITKQNQTSDRSKQKNQSRQGRKRQKSNDRALYQSKDISSRTKLSQKQNISACLNMNMNLNRKQRVNSKPSTKLDSRIQNSINYGRVSIGDGISQPLNKTKMNKSIDKSVTNHRDSHFDNRLSRKYKQKFNQSLVSRSKDKISRYSNNVSTHVNMILPNKTKIDNSVRTCRNDTNEMSLLMQETKDGKQNREAKNRNRRTNSRKIGCSQSIKADLQKIPKTRWL